MVSMAVPCLLQELLERHCLAREEGVNRCVSSAQCCLVCPGGESSTCSCEGGVIGGAAALQCWGNVEGDWIRGMGTQAPQAFARVLDEAGVWHSSILSKRTRCDNVLLHLGLRSMTVGVVVVHLHRHSDACYPFPLFAFKYYGRVFHLSCALILWLNNLGLCGWASACWALRYRTAFATLAWHLRDC